MDSRAFFDKLAPEWDDNEVLSTPSKVNQILDLMEIRNGMSVLDLGTGTGILIPFLAERVGKDGKITAVDYSRGMLDRAKAKYGNLSPAPDFLNIDFETENIEEEYDKIILYCVYPHLHEPIDTLKWLNKVNLKENGEMFIAFPCSQDFINNIHKERHSESDMLPSASELASRLQASSLPAVVVQEDENTYVVKIRKSS